MQLIGAGSVSYTHLDVYKRQEIRHELESPLISAHTSGSAYGFAGAGASPELLPIDEAAEAQRADADSEWRRNAERQVGV